MNANDSTWIDNALNSIGNNGINNYCEVVSVPTSAHVAQIVGKQGSKIKLLRSKSSTYIQTPVTGEEPVFIITGRREDVLKVKAEILSAAEHFTAISADRAHKLRQNTSAPGSVSIKLVIPSYLIGLVVGKNGNTIRNVQKMSDTYIETPKYNETTGFKITGLLSNVTMAKEHILAHLKHKTSLDFDTIQIGNEIHLQIDIALNNHLKSKSTHQMWTNV